MYEIIIVGAGPAGLTAALYARRANKKVLVLEAKNYGGQIINASKIENYPALPNISGFDYATNLYQQVKDLGVEIKYEAVIRIEEEKIVVTKENRYQAKAIILATGTTQKKLGLPEEENYIGKGVSYCATCDGAFYKNKVVAVVGGGNTALEDALYLSDLAKKVYLIHRREEFRGEEKYIEEIKQKKNIIIQYHFRVVKIRGKNQVEKIDIEDQTKHTKSIKIDGLFIAIGQTPNNQIFHDMISLDQDGYIQCHDDVYTNKEGIYVAGDARVKPLRQLTTAVADGALAATMAIKEMR